MGSIRPARLSVFLGDVNLFHGRAHEGLVHLEGMELDSPEHRAAQNAKAFAYVRPHDLDVERHAVGAGLTSKAAHAALWRNQPRHCGRPIKWLKLIPAEAAKPADNAAPGIFD